MKHNYLCYLATMFTLLFATFGAKAADEDYGLFAHFDFSDGAKDALGNVEATASGLTFGYDTALGMNAMSFNADNKGNLRLDTYPLADEMTISLWFKRNDIDPSACWRMIFSWYAPDNSAIYLTPRTNWGDEAFLVTDNKPYANYKTTRMKAVADDTWVHFAVTFSGGAIRTYQDGKFVASGKMICGVTDFATTKHYFGNFPENNYSMTGSIADIRIYHSCLAANQINALWQKMPLPAPSEEVQTDDAKVSLSFDGVVTDIASATPLSANVSCSQSPDGRMAGHFTGDSHVSILENPTGDSKWSALVWVYVSENTDEYADKTLLAFTSATGNSFKVCSRVSDGNIKLEAVRNEGGTEKTTGLTTAALQPGEWNMVSVAQTYNNVGNGAVRLYINDASPKTGVSFKTNNLSLDAWTLGSLQNDAMPCWISSAKFYTRELSADEISRNYKVDKSTISLTLMPGNEHQTIRNFGGSDGWTGQFAGLYLSEAQREHIAELLFSTENDAEGNPKGIGMTAWRFNIGAGTSEQGENSRITDETRRSECFLNADGATYDWSKQAGQQAILNLAVKKYNVPDIIGWQNSPPVVWTRNNLGFRETTEPKGSILLPEHYGDFARFLADVICHFRDEGINFKYISPLNEPQFDWTCDATTGKAKQEGSPWSNQEIHDVVTAIGNEFAGRGLDSKMFITESGNINYLLSSSSGFAQNQINAFWGDGDLSLTGVASLAPIVSSHSYWTDGSAEAIIDTRRNLRKELDAKEKDLEYWQTEYSFLGEGYRFGHPGGQLSDIACAISLARVMHADLAVADATGWQWWTTFEMDKNLSAEDRFALIRVTLKPDKSGGIFNSTKLMYGFGNFSRFVRPGMKRIEISRSDDMDDYTSVTNQMFSAYKDGQTGNVVIVAINASDYGSGISIPEVSAADGTKVTEFTPYVTSGKESDNLRRYDNFAAGDRFVLPARSIVTFVGNATEDSGIEEISVPQTGDNVRVYPVPANDIINIESASPVKYCRLFDVSGKPVMQQAVHADDARINVSDIRPGLYLLNIDTEAGSVTRRVIISH